MIPARRHSAAHGIRESFGGSNVAKQARRKSSAKGFVEHRGRKVIGIPSRDAQRNHMNVALIHVGFVDLVISRLGGFVLYLGSVRRPTLWPLRKTLAQTNFPLRLIEEAHYPDNYIYLIYHLCIP